MSDRGKTDQNILDTKIAPLEARWSPFREDPLVPVDEESLLQTFANAGNEGARGMLSMARTWKGTRVPRKRIAEFSCGLLNRKTMANLDCEGKGPEGKSYFGKFVVYEKWKLVWWMFRRYCKPDPQKSRTSPKKRTVAQ
jgi:hypothetical protein